MNKEELMQFVEWLPNNVEEFKGMDPDQIVNTLNKLSESEEGIATLNELMSTYKKSKQMFRKGGKIEYLVSKFQEGGVYDRLGAKAKKLELRREHGRGWRGEQNVVVKKAKAANVDGFSEDMYNFDTNQDFDRKEYRQRKHVARDINPEWTRRQRKAWALMDLPEVSTATMDNRKIDMPINLGYGIKKGKAIVDVGGPIVTDIEIDRIPEQPVVGTSNIPAPKWSFNQFAGRLDEHINKNKAIKTGSDTRAFQVWRAKEYERYMRDPEKYSYYNMPDNYKVTNSDLAKYSGFLANNRGAGYYDPSDTRYDYIFNTGVAEIPQSQFSDVMSDVALGSAIAPAIMAAASQIPTGGARSAGQYVADKSTQAAQKAKEVVQKVVDKGREVYSQSADDAAREYMRTNNRFQPQAHYTSELIRGGAGGGSHYVNMGGNQFGHFLGNRALYLLQNGGKVTTTPNGLLIETEEGYVDEDNNPVHYSRGLISDIINSRKTDAMLREANEQTEVVHDIFGPIYFRITYPGYVQDTTVSRNGEVYRNTALRRKLEKLFTGDSEYDRINRSIDSLLKK